MLALSISLLLCQAANGAIPTFTDPFRPDDPYENIELLTHDYCLEKQLTHLDRERGQQLQDLYVQEMKAVGLIPRIAHSNQVIPTHTGSKTQMTFVANTTYTDLISFLQHLAELPFETSVSNLLLTKRRFTGEDAHTSNLHLSVGISITLAVLTDHQGRPIHSGKTSLYPARNLVTLLQQLALARPDDAFYRHLSLRGNELELFGLAADVEETKTQLYQIPWFNQLEAGPSNYSEDDLHHFHFKIDMDLALAKSL